MSSTLASEVCESWAFTNKERVVGVWVGLWLHPRCSLPPIDIVYVCQYAGRSGRIADMHMVYFYNKGAISLCVHAV